MTDNSKYTEFSHPVRCLTEKCVDIGYNSLSEEEKERLESFKKGFPNLKEDIEYVIKLGKMSRFKRWAVQQNWKVIGIMFIAYFLSISIMLSLGSSLSDALGFGVIGMIIVGSFYMVKIQKFIDEHRSN